MGKSSEHHEDVEYLMEAEEMRDEIRSLQGIDEAARRVKHPSCKEPEERTRLQGMNQRHNPHNGDPAHEDVYEGCKPPGGMDPEDLEHDAHERHSPDSTEEAPPPRPPERHKAEGCIGGCDKHEDHHVINLS